MYETFYGLKEKPFSMLPDPAYLYLSRQHDTAITLLEYSLENQAGFCIITGKAGTGKTTLLRRLLHRVGDEVAIGLISNTHHSFGELMRWILLAFDLGAGGKTRAEMHQIFVDYLIGQYAKNRRTMLIIDEAQNLSSDALEELRMLSNINSEKDLLLHVILVGQPALRDILRQSELEQFAQRIAVDFHLESLSRDETRGYVWHRIKVAGGERDLFSDDACDAVYEYSGGTPRLINLLCDIALVYAYAGMAAIVTGEIVEQIVREREIHGALPLFAKGTHARQGAPADAVLPLSAAGTSDAASVDIRSVIFREGSAKSSPPLTARPARERVHAMESSSMKQAPEPIATSARNVEAVDTGKGEQGIVTGSRIAQRFQQLPDKHGSKACAIGPNVSSAAALSMINHAKVTTQPERPMAPSHSESISAKTRSSIKTDKSRTRLVMSEALTQQRPDRPSLISGRGSVKRQAVTATKLQKGSSTVSSTRRYFTAAAAIGLLAFVSIGGWLIYNYKPGLTPDEYSGASQVQLLAATPAPEVMSTPSTPTTVPDPQPAIAEQPTPAQNASTASVAIVNNSLGDSKMKSIDQERDVALAKAKTAEREHKALRAAAIVREQVLAAEREAALAQEREKVSRLAREAEKAIQEARDTQAAAVMQENKPRSMPIPVPAASLQAAVSVGTAVAKPVGLVSSSPIQNSDGGTGEPISFSANPCKGPSAKFLSTCQ